jgi:protein SSD1
MGQFALPSQNSTNSPSSSSNNNNNNAGNGALPKGHGRRHSVNVARRDPPNLNTSFSFPAGNNNPTQQFGGHGGNNNQSIGGNAEMAAFLASVNESNNNNTLDPSENPHVGRAYGHGRRESRGSIGSLAGWGSSGLPAISDFRNNHAERYLVVALDSNIVTQSSVPITQTNVTDLAQAQAQLQQLSQFRASAGHSRVPSFGIQQLGNNQQQQGGNNNQQQRKSLFAPYLPAASIPPLLQTGKLVIGVLRVNKRNRSDAYVATDVLDADVFSGSTLCIAGEGRKLIELNLCSLRIQRPQQSSGRRRRSC